MPRYLFILLFIFSNTSNVDAQTKNYLWGNDRVFIPADKTPYQTTVFGTKDGLPSSEILSLAQDSRGFLWIGTSSGLSRFDGVNFENYLKIGNQLIGRTNCIKEDTLRKVIWIASEHGLFYFKNGIVTQVLFSGKKLTVYDVFLNNDGMLLGTAIGAAFIPGVEVNKVIEKPGKNVSLHDNLLLQNTITENNFAVYKIISNAKGEIYLASVNAIFLYRETKLIKIWEADPILNDNDKIAGLVQYKDSVFFATVFDGLFYVKNKEVEKITSPGEIYAQLIVANNNLYYFTTGGIYRLNAGSFLSQRLSEIPAKYNLWPSCILVDNENNTWLGMHDNLLYQRPDLFQSYSGNPDQDIVTELFSVAQMRNGQFIFGANRGKVYKINSDTFVNVFGTKRIFHDAEVKALLEDSRGWLWMGSGYQGIAISKNNQIIHLTTKDGLASQNNLFLYEDSAENIYSGGDGGFSKISYNKNTGKFLIKNFYYHTAGENLETFKNCIPGPGNRLWLGGKEGLFYLQNDSLHHFFLKPGFNPDVSDITIDKAGSVWITTRGDGIWNCVFNQHNFLQEVDHFTTSNGLPSNIYLSVTVDKYNTIWGANYAGISAISVDKTSNETSIVNYNSSNGFIGENYQWIKLFSGSSDSLWCATSAGLVRLNLSRAHIRRLMILSFVNISFTNNSSNAISTIIGNDLSTFPYNINNARFSYKANMLSDEVNIQYSWRLSGIRDSAWSDWSAMEESIFENLSPNNYTFQVRARSKNGNLVSRISFNFTIEKPYWESWWFILLAGVAAVFTSIILFNYLERFFQKRNNIKLERQKLISENLQYRLEEEQVTNYFNTSILSSNTVDGLLWDVAKKCISKLNFEDCVIYLLDENTNTLFQKAAWGPKAELQNSGEEIRIVSPLSLPLGKGIVGSVASSGIAEIVNDVSMDCRYIPDDEVRQSEISVPIIYNNEVLGVIDSESSEKNSFTKRHLQILHSIANHCAERIVKLRADENLRENKIKLLETSQRLAEEKLVALRSQMNPHFIFNCLNSIQQFILTGDSDNANRYLSRFSKLMRMVLNQSEKDYISLEDEINMLELYLTLEKIRFGNSFEFEIVYDNMIDTDEINIPNLLIQPFVENAIWHGLMHKKDDRKLSVTFSFTSQEKIECQIIDNGIGRKEARKIAGEKLFETRHKSKGMQLVEDKIQALREKHEKEIIINVEDILIDGKVCGTCVTLLLAVNYFE